jgi:hypothetical protein
MPQLVNLRATTETDAVNTMLAAIGEAPISNADNATQPDAMLAINILRELCREVLTEGWRFNTKYNVELQPDDEIEIDGTVMHLFEVPIDMLRFDATLDIGEFPYVYAANFVVPAFYDLNNQRAHFPTSTLQLARAIYYVGWPYMPETARQYVLKLAVNRFVETLGTREQVYFSTEDVERSRRLLERDQRITRRFNIFRGSEFFDVMGGRS